MFEEQGPTLVALADASDVVSNVIFHYRGKYA